MKLKDLVAFFKKSCEKIGSQRELNIAVQEESRELGLSPISVQGWFSGLCLAEVNPTATGYDIFFERDSLTTRADVRHRIYHVYKRDCKTPHSFLKRTFIQEPRATIYALLGLKV